MATVRPGAMSLTRDPPGPPSIWPRMVL